MIVSEVSERAGVRRCDVRHRFAIPRRPSHMSSYRFEPASRKRTVDEPWRLAMQIAQPTLSSQAALVPDTRGLAQHSRETCIPPIEIRSGPAVQQVPIGTGGVHR